jgi:hypothetical protein
MAPTSEPTSPNQLRLSLRVIALALALNVVAWIGASLAPAAQAIWPVASLFAFFVIGIVIGDWRALWVTLAFGVIHAVPVLLGLLPGFLSTWEEALWWIIALAILLTLTGLGVLGRKLLRRLRTRSVGSPRLPRL